MSNFERFANRYILRIAGAGFASQRTKSDDVQLDLSDYVGIQLRVEKADGIVGYPLKLALLLPC